MIIVKQASGDTFINDKEMVLVDYSREKKEVVVNGHNIAPPAPHLYDVESVTYYSDAKAAEYKSESLELEKVKKERDYLNDRCKKWSSAFKQMEYDVTIFAFDMAEGAKYALKNNDKDFLLRVIERSDKIRGKMLNHFYTKDL
jgi:hypothetical protein